MFLNENEVRKIIRKRLLEQSTEFQGVSTAELGADKQSGAEVAGEVATAVATGIGVATAVEAAAVAATSTSIIGQAGAVALGGPVAWGVAAGVAAAAGVSYLLLAESDVGKKVETILDGTFGAKTQKELSKIEEQTKKKLKEAGMEDELATFPSLQHAALKQSMYKGWAKDFHDAMKGSGDLAFGAGTDEKKIKKTIQDIGKNGSLMDLSITAVIYFKENLEGDNGTLIKHLQEELSDSDMEEFVRKPIEAIENIICWNDGGKRNCYSRKELEAWIAETDKVIKAGGVEEGGGETIDPNTLKGNNIQKIQHIMNKYSEREKLGVTITEDGDWGPETDRLWTKFLNHVVVNHKTFKGNDFLQTFKNGFHSWSSVSAASVSTYPGYTSSLTGCLCFVVDGYNGNTDYGEGKKKISGGKVTKGGGGPGPKKKQRTDVDQQAAIDDSGAGSVGARLQPDVRVTLAGPGKDTLESIGFPAQTSERLASTIATRVRGTITGGTINLTVVANRNGKVSSVRVAPGQRRNPINKQFENLKNVVRRFLEKAGNADNSLIEPSKARETFRAKSRKFELVLDFPPGTYN